MRTIVFHYHMFKNAGTSVDELLQGSFGDGFSTREFGRVFDGGSDDLRVWIEETPECRAYSSHTAFAPIPPIADVDVVTVAMLRDPLDRIRSAYGFARKQPSDAPGPRLAKTHDIEDWVRIRLTWDDDRQCRNFQTACLARLAPGPEPELERAKRALDEISAWGVVDDFERFVDRLTRRLATPYPDFRAAPVWANRASGPAAPLSDALVALLEAENADDLALLDHARGLLASD